MNIIETKNLCKKSGSQIRVNHLNLAVPEGCVYGFLGPNGAGKSTSLKMLLGLIQQNEGEVFLCGKKMNAQNRLSLLRNTGSLIENPSYYRNLTGLENLKLVARWKKVSEAEVKEVLDLVHLTKHKDKKVKEYSLGMKQRLGIAMALLGHPEILLLDEPTNGLDPAGIQEIRELIKNLPKTRNTTVIVSSHLLSEIQQMADQVGIIHHGELIFQGTMDELTRNNHQDLEQIFLEMTGGEAS